MFSGYLDLMEFMGGNIWTTHLEFVFHPLCDDGTLKDLQRFSVVSGAQSADPFILAC